MVAPLAGAWIETRLPVTDAQMRQVAPLAGAWIETPRPLKSSWGDWSPPSRGRGLKHRRKHHAPTGEQVAPLAGAWIETKKCYRGTKEVLVAPLAGAWIETLLTM